MDMHEDPLGRDRCGRTVCRVGFGSEITAWNLVTAAGRESDVGSAWKNDGGRQGGLAVPAHFAVAGCSCLRISSASHHRSDNRQVGLLCVMLSAILPARFDVI